MSGTISPDICHFTFLRGFTGNAQFISGTLPKCFGQLTNIGVLGLARNYMEGAIPGSLDSLTSMKTMILASNRFKCNTPDMDKSLGLGAGRFSGVSYPSTLDLAQTLFETANIPISVFRERLAGMLPSVDNVVLLFTGNGKLTTSASTIGGDTKDTAPIAVKQDAIRQGK